MAIDGARRAASAESLRALDALNLFDTKANQIMYAYGSLLKSDPLYAQCKSATPPPVAVCQNGVMDAVLHPTEPLAVRLTVTGVF